MPLWCVCDDCGRQFRSEKDERLCQYCWERDAAIYSNREPNPEEDALFRRSRVSRPTSPIVVVPGSGAWLESHPVPKPAAGPLLTCRCGKTGTEGFTSQPNWPKPLCSTCARDQHEKDLAEISGKRTSGNA